jgi:hypothetical protein
MDFAAPPAVIATLQQRIAHGVFGYGGPWPTLTESVLAHLEREYSWPIAPEWIVWLPGFGDGLERGLPRRRWRCADRNADLPRPSFRHRHSPAQSPALRAEGKAMVTGNGINWPSNRR